MLCEHGVLVVDAAEPLGFDGLRIPVAGEILDVGVGQQLMEQLAGLAAEGDPHHAVFEAFGFHHGNGLAHEAVLMALRILFLDLEHELASQIFACIEILLERGDLLTVLQSGFLQGLEVGGLDINLAYILVVMNDDDIVFRQMHVKLGAVASDLVSEFQ